MKEKCGFRNGRKPKKFVFHWTGSSSRQTLKTNIEFNYRTRIKGFKYVQNPREHNMEAFRVLLSKQAENHKY